MSDFDWEGMASSDWWHNQMKPLLEARRLHCWQQLELKDDEAVRGRAQELTDLLTMPERLTREKQRDVTPRPEETERDGRRTGTRYEYQPYRRTDE